MLSAHVAHVLEEVWGGFFMRDVLGPGGFLIANWVLWSLPATIFYFVLRGRRWAHWLGIAYAGIMLANGIGHNVMTLITGRYFGGFAGGYTGIALALIAVPLGYALWKEMPGDMRP
jgi:hypothetical protein